MDALKDLMGSTPKAPRSRTVQPASGVKVEPAPHGANVIDTSRYSNTTTAKEVLARSCHREFSKLRNDNLIQSTFEDATDGSFIPAQNGFVDGAVHAYNQHHHLIIRPEDIWFSILVQINVYINAHAEDMRSMFVAHEGKKELKLYADKDADIIGGKYQMGVDWAKFAYQIGKKIEENIVDPSLRQWFMPAFTTTTKSDQATASIIMMSAMQKYFDYTCGIFCGLPSVTLLGQKGDWEEILTRAERLKTFGEEPTMFYGLLKPVLTRFVQTFDDPDSEEIRDFWQKIAHYSGGGSGPTYLSGWITAFCFWDNDGKCFHSPGRNPSNNAEMRSMGQPTPVLVLGGARYHRIETSDIPAGYASVPVKMDYETHVVDANMVAGSIGIRLSSSSLELDSPNSETGLDTMQPGCGWAMYEVMSEEEVLEEKRKKYDELRKRYPDLYPEWKGQESVDYMG